MPAPPTPTPTRPESVPATATWEDAHGLWREGEDDEAGQWNGPQRTYRRDGSLIGEFVYVGGKPDGKFRRFHPTGEISIEGEHTLGAPTGARITYRSSGGSDEAVFTCCLPTKAVKVVASYEADGRVLEDYFDADGNAILANNEPHPERPEGVGRDARFDAHQRLWIAGTYERARRHGEFTFWTESGRLIERAHFKHGVLDGLRERLGEGRRLDLRMYKGGELDGPAWERVPTGRFESPDIVAQEGYYDRGCPTGKWRYLSETGNILATVDLGQPLEEVQLDDAILRTVTHQDNLALDPAREHLRCLVWLAHAGDREALERAAAGVPRLNRDVSAAWLARLRDERQAPSKYVAQLLQALRRGMRPEHVLRALSVLYLREPEVGLQLLRVSLTLAPEEVETLGSEVLFLTALGRLAAARRRIAAMKERFPREADDLAFNLDITFPRFTYLPADAEWAEDASPDLPNGVGQPAGALRVALVKACKRVCVVRSALLALFPETREFALPPDVSAWARAEKLSLEDYSFEAEGDEIRVQETLEVNTLTLPELMLQARTEWTTLCWLLYSCGAPANPRFEQQPFPEAIAPPEHFAGALTRAFRDLYRVTDQLRTAGIRSHTQGLPDATWEGRNVAGLSHSLLLQAFAEFRERRAALFFAADETCRSAWQDDLRAT